MISREEIFSGSLWVFCAVVAVNALLSSTPPSTPIAMLLGANVVVFSYHLMFAIRDRLKNIERRIQAKLMEKIHNYFKGDVNKVLQWLHTKNPALGNIAPGEMIAKDQEKELLKVIDAALRGNNP